MHAGQHSLIAVRVTANKQNRLLRFIATKVAPLYGDFACLIRGLKADIFSYKNKIIKSDYRIREYIIVLFIHAPKLFFIHFVI